MKLFLLLPLALCGFGCKAKVTGAKTLAGDQEIEPGLWRREVILPGQGDARRAWIYRPKAALAAQTNLLRLDVLLAGCLFARL